MGWERWSACRCGRVDRCRSSFWNGEGVVGGLEFVVEGLILVRGWRWKEMRRVVLLLVRDEDVVVAEVRCPSTVDHACFILRIRHLFVLVLIASAPPRGSSEGWLTVAKLASAHAAPDSG